MAAEQTEVDCKVGDYVEIGTKGGKLRRGFIRFEGKVKVVGHCYGIELDEAIDDGTDGSLDGEQYFKCEEGRGKFIKPQKIKRKLDTPPDGKQTSGHKSKTSGDSASKKGSPGKKGKDKRKSKALKNGSTHKVSSPRKSTKGKSASARSSPTSSHKTSAEKDKLKNGTKRHKRPSSARSKSSLSLSRTSSARHTGAASGATDEDVVIDPESSDMDKLEYIYGHLAVHSSLSHSKRVELLKVCHHMIEDEKAEDAVFQRAISGFKKVFTEQMKDKKYAVHKQLYQMMKVMMDKHPKSYKTQNTYFLKTLMNKLDKLKDSETNEMKQIESVALCMIRHIGVSDKKQLIVMLNEFVRNGTASKSKRSTKKVSWTLILKALRAKHKAVDTVPGTVLDSVEKGLKQGLSNKDKTIQKGSFEVLEYFAMELQEHDRVEKLFGRMSASAQKAFHKKSPLACPSWYESASSGGKRSASASAASRDRKAPTPRRRLSSVGQFQITSDTTKSLHRKKDSLERINDKGKQPMKGKKGKKGKSNGPNKSQSAKKAKSSKAKTKANAVHSPKKGRDRETQSAKKHKKSPKSDSKKPKKKKKRQSVKGKKSSSTDTANSGDNGAGGRTANKSKKQHSESATKKAVPSISVAGSPGDDDEESMNSNQSPGNEDDLSTPGSSVSAETMEEEEEDDNAGNRDHHRRSNSHHRSRGKLSGFSDPGSPELADALIAILPNGPGGDDEPGIDDDDDDHDHDSNEEDHENGIRGDGDRNDEMPMHGDHHHDRHHINDEEEGLEGPEYDDDIPITMAKSETRSPTHSGYTDDGMDSMGNDLGFSNFPYDLLTSDNVLERGITWKMLEYLCQGTKTHQLMAVLSRMEPSIKIYRDKLEEIDYDNAIPDTLPLFSEEESEIEATHLSWNLMRLLSTDNAHGSGTEAVSSYLLRQCQDILLHSLAVFHTTKSKGNVYHGRVLLEILLNTWPKSLMSALTKQPAQNESNVVYHNTQILFKNALFRNLHQGNLNSFFLDLICYKHSEKYKQILPWKKRIIQLFKEWKFMEYLLKTACSHKVGVDGNDDVPTKMATFFIDLVARSSAIEEVAPLFENMENVIIDSFMEGILDADRQRTTWHRMFCGQILIQFMDICSRPTIMDPAQLMAAQENFTEPEPSPNILYPLFDKCLKRLHSYIPQLSDLVINYNSDFRSIRLNYGTIRKPFGQIRLHCLELLTISADFAQFECGNVLGMIPMKFWNYLLEMAFLHKNNNIFLCHFRRLIHLTMIFRRRILKHLFVEKKMLDRFITFYATEKGKTPLHGYVLQMVYDIWQHDQEMDDSEDDEDDEDDDDDSDGNDTVVSPDDDEDNHYM